jgi:hypothetical protein
VVVRVACPSENFGRCHPGVHGRQD